MKFITTIAILLAVIALPAKADTPFVSSLFTAKCAVLNADLKTYGQDYESHVEGMLMGFLTAYSIVIYTDEDLARFIPAVEGTSPLFTQVVFKHCRDNPADQVLNAAAQSLTILAVDKT